MAFGSICDRTENRNTSAAVTYAKAARSGVNVFSLAAVAATKSGVNLFQYVAVGYLRKNITKRYLVVKPLQLKPSPLERVWVRRSRNFLSKQHCFEIQRSIFDIEQGDSTTRPVTIQASLPPGRQVRHHHPVHPLPARRRLF
jgi:hypothetical protein